MNHRKIIIAVSTFALGIVGLLLLQPAEAQQEANQPAPQPGNVVTEAGTGQTVVGFVKSGLREFPVWAQTYAAPVSDSTPFEYLPPYRIVPLQKGSPLFDPKTNRLQFRLEPQELKEDDLETVKAFYTTRGESTETIKPLTMRTRPLAGYQVLLKHPTVPTKLVLEEEVPKLGKTLNGPISVDQKIENEALRQALIDTPGAVTVQIEMTYPARQWQVQQVKVHLLENAAVKAWESVVGDGTVALLGRNITNDLSGAIRKELIFTIENMNVDSAVSQLLLDRATKFADDLSASLTRSADAPLDDLATLAEDGAVIVTEQLRGEAAARVTSDMKDSFKSGEEYSKNFERSWDKLVSLAKSSTSFDQFVKDARGSGGIGVQVKGVTIGLSGSGSKGSTETTQQIYNLAQSNKDTGSLRDDLMRKSFEEWTGKVWSTEVEPKTLKLAIARRRELTSSISATFRIADEVGRMLQTASFNYQLSENHDSLLEERVAKLEGLRLEGIQHIATTQALDSQG